MFLDSCEKLLSRPRMLRNSKRKKKLDFSHENQLRTRNHEMERKLFCITIRLQAVKKANF